MKLFKKIFFKGVNLVSLRLVSFALAVINSLRPGEVRRRISTMAVKAFCCSSMKSRKLSIFLMNCQILAFPIFVAEASTVDIPPPRVILFIYGTCLGYSRRGLPEPFPAAGFHVHQRGETRSLHTLEIELGFLGSQSVSAGHASGIWSSCCYKPIKALTLLAKEVPWRVAGGY